MTIERGWLNNVLVLQVGKYHQDLALTYFPQNSNIFSSILFFYQPTTPRFMYEDIPEMTVK